MTWHERAVVRSGAEACRAGESWRGRVSGDDWNVENLFEVGDEDGPDTQAELKAKIESLRSVIDLQKPHVLGLQEIGSEVRSADSRLRLDPMPHRVVAAPDERGIRVAFLSRRVLNDPIQIRPFPGGLLPVQVGDDPPGPDGPRTMNLMGRAALQVTVRANGRTCICRHASEVEAAHVPRRLSPADEDQRAGLRPTRSTGAPPKQPRSAPTSTRSSPARARPGP